MSTAHCSTIGDLSVDIESSTSKTGRPLYLYLIKENELHVIRAKLRYDSGVSQVND